MFPLNTELLAKKNLLSTDGAYAYCMDITLLDGTDITVTTDGNPVNWNSKQYVPFEFTINALGGEKAGEVPQSTVQVSNISRALVPYLENGVGGVGADVLIHVVNTKMTSGPSMYTAKFLCTGCDVDARWVTFTLGVSNPLRQRFPRNTIRKNQCTWRYRGIGCGYTGGFIACDKTLVSCELRGNTARFGNFPGAGRGGLDV